MLANGRHILGPDTGTLQVRTAREGAYARAGHDLVMDVERWEGVLDVSDDAVSLEITCDARSLRVRWGFNGTTSLSDKDRADIGKTIDTKVLQGAAIRFRSTNVRHIGEKLRIAGDLTIGTTTRRIEFDLRTSDDGTRADATARVRQTTFGIKPYSAMLATLKVGDDVEITARAALPRWTAPVVAATQPDALEEPVEPVPAAAASIEPRQPVLSAARVELTSAADAIERPVPVRQAAPAPEIEPWRPVARHYSVPQPATDQIEAHVPAAHAAPTPVADAIEPWQPVPTQHSAPTPVAAAIAPTEPPVPVGHVTPTAGHVTPPAGDAIEPFEHPMPDATPMPAADADAIEPLEPPVHAHAMPTREADANEPQPVLAEDPPPADAIEPRRPTPPHVAHPREPTRRLGFFGPVRFR